MIVPAIPMLTTVSLFVAQIPFRRLDRKSTRLNSSHLVISYAVFCLKKNDSLLDIVIVEDVPLLFLLRQFPNLFAGTHVLHPRVRQIRVAEIHIEALPPYATIPRVSL